MPIIKSAIKRAKQTKVRTARNKVTKQTVRTEVKALQSAIDAKDTKKAQEQLVVAQSAIDTAVKKNLMHKNKAARKKSQLNAQVKAMAGSTKPAAAKKAPAKKPAASKTTAKKAPAKKTATKK